MNEHNSIPRYIRLGGHIITILPVKNLITKQEAFGMWDDGKMEIHIDAGLSLSLTWETFWHEVVEAINSTTEMELAHHKIQTMGLLLHQVFESMREDNQKLVIPTLPKKQPTISLTQANKGVSNGSST